MALAVREMKWLRTLLIELGVPEDQPMSLHYDNQAALHIVASPVFHERTKHVEIDCHGVRDAIQEGLVVTRKVHTAEQVADIFTKALGCCEFEILRDKLGIFNPHAPAWGGVLAGISNAI